ncbi:phospholipase [Fusarium heterosporum]|uniref:phospholipase D n=1 Tax=Fusarium heterosporum TaxID=42747 RepID=A0A8H5WXD8_FUSHE|nr:phospholipase [Fusarium heterosporum]
MAISPSLMEGRASSLMGNLATANKATTRLKVTASMEAKELMANPPAVSTKENMATPKGVTGSLKDKVSTEAREVLTNIPEDTLKESHGQPQGYGQSQGGGKQPHGNDTSHDAAAQYLQRQQAVNRYHSFAAESKGNVKWYVDGASYFWAVSEALEQARESIYILDWWLSPELYLRRPPAKNEQYRLDRMLLAAAERGVSVNIIVYKEVEAALTLNSAHTRTALEALHDNIRVFRHPDHVPTGYDLQRELGKSIKALTNFDLFKASGDALKAVYGTTGDIVLYWAHHEKLLVIDNGKIGFMGGLDMCFGRWDTSSHPIADSHPGDLDRILFPGQDFNNARVYDFADVKDWDQNKLDRTKSSRMGWSDVALSMNGPITRDMVDHFVDRWNFLFKEKYSKKNPGKYHKIELPPRDSASRGDRRSRGEDDYLGGLTEQFSRGMNRLRSFGEHDEPHDRDRGHRSHGSGDMPRIQMIRSCAEWSSGHPLERSIQNAYIQTIKEAKHCIYIENQFFITSTDDKQKTVKNKIGAALVERIIRADHEQEPFFVWVLMPAVPAFAGDLHDKDALGTRAIMEFQYDSISRGDNSIIVKLQKAGIRDTSRYIAFYNLRNFDRINTSKTMADAEARTGVSYEDARKEREGELGAYPDESSGRRAREDYQSSRGDFSSSREGGGYQNRDYGGRSERDDYRADERRDDYRGQSDEYQRGDNYGSQGGRDPYSHPGADPRFASRPQGYDGARQDEGGYSQQGYGGRNERNPYDHPQADPRFSGRQDDRYGSSRYDERPGQGYSRQSGSRYDDRSDSRYDDRPQRQEHQERYSGSSSYDNRPQSQEHYSGRTDQYQRYQQGASKVGDHTLDTISACYMDHGPRVADLHWDGNPEDEINAFVSEELYIHSKLLIADDRIVICGSANLNDRSQLGDHDSEIAVVIEDPTPVESYMNGRPYTASRFAASLRRYLFRKHLGLIPDQRWDQPTENWTPVDRDPNNYDWGSPADLLVRDPLHPDFHRLWTSTARVNTETFDRAFHPVPSNRVRTWKEYDSFFSQYFIIPGKKDQDVKAEIKKGKVEYGHIVRSEFPGGVQEVKEWLSRVRGTLVEMPLDFLVDAGDIAKEDLTLNSLTYDLYT